MQKEYLRRNQNQVEVHSTTTAYERCFIKQRYGLFMRSEFMPYVVWDLPMRIENAENIL